MRSETGLVTAGIDHGASAFHDCQPDGCGNDPKMKRFLPWFAVCCLALPLLAKDIRVVVWDEQQAAQKQAYTNFLGNQIAAHLKTVPGLSVKSVALTDPDKGLADEVLNNCDVLIWWGHQKHTEISSEKAKEIAHGFHERLRPVRRVQRDE